MLQLYGPVDVEGHMGRDGRLYVLDTARLFPPSTPTRGYVAVCTSDGSYDRIVVAL